MPLFYAQVNFTGGTGEVIFDENGDRLGFAGAIYNYKSITNLPSAPNEVRADGLCCPVGTVTMQAMPASEDL